MRDGAAAGLITLRTGSPCWNPPSEKRWRRDRSPREMPKEARSASTWCSGGSPDDHGMARKRETEVKSCQKEKSLPTAGSDRRSETDNLCPCSEEMLRTKRFVSEYDHVSLVAARRPVATVRPWGLVFCARPRRSYCRSIRWVRSTCVNWNAAVNVPPTARSV